MIVGNDPCDLERLELPDGVSLWVKFDGQLYPAWIDKRFGRVWCAVGVVGASVPLVIKCKKRWAGCRVRNAILGHPCEVRKE